MASSFDMQARRACIIYQDVKLGAHAPNVLSQPPHLGQAGQVASNRLDSGVALRHLPYGVCCCGGLGLRPASTVQTPGSALSEAVKYGHHWLCNVPARDIAADKQAL